jgi:hypothetical protein
MSKTLPRWFAESTDRLMAIDCLITRGAEQEDEDKEEEDKKEKEEGGEDEGDGYSE